MFSANGLDFEAHKVPDNGGNAREFHMLPQRLTEEFWGENSRVPPFGCSN